MKKSPLIIIAIATALHVNAQHELYNNGAGLYIASGGTLFINGSFTNTGTDANLQNNGTLTVTGNLTNNQTMSAYTGNLVLNGNTSQNLGGTADMLTQTLEVNNAAGIILDAKLKVNGTVTLTDGIITAAVTDAPLWFTANATHTGASDAAHVNGYVVKEGTGNFTYPVGDDTRYQKIKVKATANNKGIQVKYNPGDAGAAPFGTTGASPTPLQYYNTKEYWDISPLGSAKGTVTVYWDDYHNEGIASPAHLAVAHKRGGYWLNEGAANVNGTVAAGNVTSASVNTWSPFTLGSFSSLSTLPLTWLNVSGNLNSGKQAVINWQVSELNVTEYQVEKSTDGRQFTSIGRLGSKGDGNNSYSFTESGQMTSNTYYRIKQTDMDGRYTYSPVIRLRTTDAMNDGIAVYPVPFTTGFTVTSSKAQKATLINSHGQVLQQMHLGTGANYINATALVSGAYYLITANGDTQKLVKQ